MNLFWALARYHYEKNLLPNTGSIRQGKMYLSKRALKEGEENEKQKGLLIVANGKTLVIDLISDGTVSKKDIAQFEKIKSHSNFFRYLERQKHKDGAFIYDGANKRIARVMEFSNRPNMPGKLKLEEKVPFDFIHANPQEPLRHHLGTKTRLAIRLSAAYPDVEAYQIKRTAYGAGLGKVTHFTKKGLVEEFFFACKPKSIKQLVPEKGIVGVYRRYELARNKPRCAEEREIGLKELRTRLMI